MREPISKPANQRFRGTTSSAEYNEAESRKYQDVVELYKQANDNFLQIKGAYETVLVENHFLNLYANQLQTAMSAIDSRIAALETGTSPFVFQDRKFAKDMTVVFPNILQTTNEVPMHIEGDYGISRIESINSVPKTYLIDAHGNHVIPNGLTVAVNRTNADKGKVDTNSTDNMFDGDETSFWKYNTTYVNPADIRPIGEEIDIEVTLPVNISSQKKINCISLNTHPLIGVEVKNLQVFYNNQWTSIYDDSIINESESGRHKWIFEEMFAEKIRFTMIQKTGLVQAGATHFYMGIQELNVTYEVFTKSTNYVLVPFNVTGMYDILGAEVTFLNRDAISYSRLFNEEMIDTIYSCKIMYEDALGVLHVLNENDWVSQSYTKLWVQVNVNVDKHNGVAPALYSVQLNYKTY